jgi:ATP-dependent DNA ligase
LPLSSQLVLGPARESEPAELDGRHRLLEMGGVVEVTYLTWTEHNLLRQVSYQGQREDKPAKQVVRPVAPPPRRSR